MTIIENKLNRYTAQYKCKILRFALQNSLCELIWISRPNMINKYLSGSILEIQIFLFILTKTKRIKYILTV